MGPCGLFKNLVDLNLGSKFGEKFADVGVILAGEFLLTITMGLVFRLVFVPLGSEILSKK